MYNIVFFVLKIIECIIICIVIYDIFEDYWCNCLIYLILYNVYVKCVICEKMFCDVKSVGE